MSLGQIIKEKRKQLGLTQLDLAEKIDVSILKLATWEADEELPTDEQFVSLSKALECDISKLTDKAIIKEEPKVVKNIQAEEKTIEKVKKEIIEEKKEEPTILCNRCLKRYFPNQIVEVSYKYREKQKVFICYSCRKLIKEEVDNKIKEKIEIDINQRRRGALKAQAIILGIALLVWIPFFCIFYPLGISFGIVSLLVSTFVSSLIFDNTAIIQSYKVLAQTSYKDEKEKQDKREKTLFSRRRGCEPSTLLLIIISPFLILVSIFVYPVALYKNLTRQGMSFETAKRRYEFAIRTEMYYSIKNKNKISDD